MVEMGDAGKRLSLLDVVCNRSPYMKLVKLLRFGGDGGWASRHSLDCPGSAAQGGAGVQRIAASGHLCHHCCVTVGKCTTSLYSGIFFFLEGHFYTVLDFEPFSKHKALSFN